MARCEPSVVVGILGPTCSGKSALAEAMRYEAREQVMVMSQHAYYLDRTGLSNAEIAQIDFDHPDALDLASLAQHLRQLRVGTAVKKPVYCRHSHRRLPGHVVSPRPIIVVEGLFLFGWPELASELDLKVFLDQTKETIVKRRLLRDTFDHGRNPVEVAACFHEKIWPGYQRHVEPTKDLADTVIAGKFDVVTVARRLLAQGRGLLKQAGSPATAAPEPVATSPLAPSWDVGLNTGGGLLNSAPAD